MTDVVEVVLGGAAFDGHAARRNLSFGVLEILQVQRMGGAEGVHVHHAASFTLGEELVGSHGQLGAIGEVVGDGVLAADIVAYLYRTGLDLEAHLLELFLEDVIEKDCLGNLAQLGVAVLVVGHGNAGILDFLGIQIMENAFCHHHGSVADTQELALENGGKRQFHNLVQGNLRLVEHLGNDGHGAMGGLTDTQGQVTGAASHSADDEPVAAGAGILVDGAGQVGALVLGAVETEGRGVLRQREVVVNGLGNVDVMDGILLGFQELGDAVGGGSGVVTTYGDQQFDLVVLEQGQVEVLFKILVGGLETAHLEIGAAAIEIGVGLEEIDFLGAGRRAEKAAVTAVKADYAESVVQEGFGHGHNHGVHARSRATATKDDDGIFHKL